MTHGSEAEWVDLHAQSCDVLLLKLSRKMTLDESGLFFVRIRVQSIKGI